MMVIFTLMLTYLGGWLLYLLLQVLSIAAGISAQLLLSILLFKPDSGITVGAGFMLGIVFGGHRFLNAPAWLRHPYESKQQEPAQNSCIKVCDIQPVAQYQQSLTYHQRSQPVTKVQQQVTSGTATFVNLTCLFGVTKRILDNGAAPASSRMKAMAAVGDETKVTGQTSRSSTDGSSKENSSDSHDESQGNTSTPPSSEDEEVNIKVDFVVKENIFEVSSDDQDVEEIDVSVLCPDKRKLVDLMRIHGNPAFHEGPLYELRRSAWDRRQREVNSIYVPGERNSHFTGMASSPDRPVSADRDDISGMLNCVRPWLPLHVQSYLANNGTHELNRARNGMTGLNTFSSYLELLWHRHRSLAINQVASVIGLGTVHDFQKLKTRKFRTACPPGLQGILTPHSTHRQYLTDEQAVKINQGCAEYATCNSDEEESQALLYLEQHLDHAGAKVDNPVLGWLDDMEGVDFYDANDYLPCPCGTQALKEHLNSRREIEPGFDPCLHGFDVSALHYLGEDALDQDRQRKANDEAHFGRTTGFPRCQTIAQDCPLHAVPTNNLWILTDGVENPNDAVTGTNNDLPVPGFTELTAYPPGFRIPQGFCEIKHELLPPRCQHGYLHPPFADHCMGCFPNEENHDDCEECKAHVVVPAIVQNPGAEREYDASRAVWDRTQWGLVRKAEEWEQCLVQFERRTFRVASHHFNGWAPVVVV